MIIPKSIRVGGHTYKVITDDNNHLHDNHNMGETNNPRLVIRINSDLPKSQIEETFLHELIHACLSFSGGYKQFEEPKEEEKLVEALTPILYTVLKENRIKFS